MYIKNLASSGSSWLNNPNSTKKDPQQVSQRMNAIWTPRMLGFYKQNFDGSTLSNYNTFCGFVIRSNA